MYTVTTGDQETEFDARWDAIQAAKGMSAEVRQRVQVLCSKGRETFIYRDGELESYEYETRPGRRQDQNHN